MSTVLDVLREAQAAGVSIRLDESGKVKIKAQDGDALAAWIAILKPFRNDLASILKTEPTDHSQDTGTAWRAMRDAYYSHHASCPTCRAAGLGYGLRCGAGAALWAEYGRDLPPPLRPRKGARG